MRLADWPRNPFGVCANLLRDRCSCRSYNSKCNLWKSWTLKLTSEFSHAHLTIFSTVWDTCWFYEDHASRRNANLQKIYQYFVGYKYWDWCRCIQRRDFAGLFNNKLVYRGAHHWSPISLVPHLIGSPSHWSPISLVPHLIDPPISTHAPLISLVPHLIGPPRLIGPPSHWSPISLVPFSLVPQFISPPLHYLNSLVPLLIGPPFH